jgi:hypothetical protein
MDLETGDVVLVEGTGFVDTLISIGARVRYHGWLSLLKKRPNDETRFTHAAVVVNGKLIEALATGLMESNLNKYDGRCGVAKLTSVSPFVNAQDRYNLAVFASNALDRHDKYGWLSILSIILEIITPLKLDISWDGALICSAFAAQCWEHAGVVLPTLSSLTTMPADIAYMAKL